MRPDHSNHTIANNVSNGFPSASNNQPTCTTVELKNIEQSTTTYGNAPHQTKD